MNLHNLKPEYRRKQKKRVGRGGKRGTYSGRGIKGQKARAGHKLQPAIRRLFKRYPKKRGYRFKPINEKPGIVNVGRLSKEFGPGDEVSPEMLLKKGLIRKKGKGIPEVKILGRGVVDKELVLKNCLFSKSAGDKIEKAGGKIVV